jgi:hypothetical protein
MVVVLAAPATGAVASPPAVDQYTQHLPGAGGGSGLASGSAPVARPWLLSARTRAALSGSDGQLLTLIATARGLGAPDASAGTAASASAGTGASGGAGTGAGGGAGTAAAVEGASSPSPSLATAVVDAAGSGSGLALLGVLAGIGIAAAGLRLVRRRRTSI